ncbi:MAG: flippase-like domain-containing protein [Sandaracinaceae bacterium]|jgi:hypothetical protein|nr:flippase-like domain-containing protein [Sandaracinaceae bacterium]
MAEGSEPTSGSTSSSGGTGGARPEGRARAWLAVALRVALAVFGLVVIAVLVRRIGAEEVAAALERTAPVLPIAFVLDAARIGCDAWSTRLMLGERGRVIPARVLFLGHVVGHGVMNVFPAGRSASEAAKAALFHRYLGAAEAISIGASNQANTLFSSGVFSLLCAGAAAIATPDTTLVTAMLVHFVVLFVSGTGMRLAATNRHVEAFFAHRFPRVGAHLGRFAAHSRETPIVAWGPVGAMMLGRLVQTIEYGVLAHAVGISVGPLEALSVQGINLVAAAIGVLMPGQLGSSEAVFALAADALHTEAANAMTIALAAHLCALTWAVVGLVLLFTWRAKAPASEAVSDAPRAPRSS